MGEQLQPGAMEMTRNPEVKEVYEYVYIGRLGDLGLGSEAGIKSPLETEEQVHEYAQKYVRCLAAKSGDPSRVGCIDGRLGEGFEDGSEYVPLDRSAGGTLSDYIMAKASKADITKTTSADNILDETDEIESSTGNIIGTAGKCSHGKGCGACVRAVDHTRLAAQPSVHAATKALMEHPAVMSVTGVTYSAEIAAKVADGFTELADELEQAGWDGNAYTERARATNQRGVEKLAGEADQLHHGHSEFAIEIVADAEAVPDETLMKQEDLGDAFGLTLGRLVRVADAQAGHAGIDGKTAGITSGIAWNVAVGSNLCHPNMPIIVVTKHAA